MKNEEGVIEVNFELGILDSIQANLRGPVMDTVMLFLTRLGDGGMIWLIGSAVLLMFPKTRKAGAAMAAGLALEVLCCNVILKPLVGRTRPCDVNQAMQLLISRPTDYSFPSGHTGASFAAASALYFSKNRLWIPAALLACLIGFSRMYLYVHYPSDVLAGALIGIMAGWAGVRFSNLIGKCGSLCK